MWTPLLRGQRATQQQPKDRQPGGCFLAGIWLNDLAGGKKFDEQVIADRIKRVRIEAGCVRGREAFVEFEIEDFKAQHLRGANVRRRARETRAIMRRGGDQQPDRFKSGIHEKTLPNTCYNPVATPLKVSNKLVAPEGKQLNLHQFGREPLANFAR